MPPLIPPESSQWPSMNPREAFPLPPVDEELDGLHSKESMRGSHRVRKVRRQQKPKRNKGLSQLARDSKVVLGRETNHQEATIPTETDKYHITILHIGGPSPIDGHPSIKPKIIGEATITGWNEIESFVRERIPQYGDIPADTLDALRKAANASDYQDNEINLIRRRGTVRYTNYMYCIEGPLQG